MTLIQQKKPYFLTEKPPPGYVAGVGRGYVNKFPVTVLTQLEQIANLTLKNLPPIRQRRATGFTTRSDFGVGDDLGPKGGAKKEENGEGEDENDGQIEGSAFDDNDRLFATGEYDAEDEEADLIYASFDEYMDDRRKRQREQKEAADLAESKAKRPKLQSLFADAKKALTKVSYDEWAALPESGSSKIRTRQERYTPVPDSLLEAAHRETQMKGSIGAWESSGTASTLGTATTLSDVQAMGTGKKIVLGSRLENASKSVISGTTTAIQREGYLSSLDTSIQSARTIGDTKQHRWRLESATQSNPTSAPSWISLARLEEESGHLKKAIKVIEQAYLNCPKNKDVWLEAARLNPIAEAKSVLARAVQHLPDDVDIWKAAAKLEDDVERKKRVYKKALERLPGSTELWREAVELEGKDEARILLSQAVKCVPHSAQMWLALARLETYENAKIVLNNARKEIPKEKLIWLAAAQLEEAQGNTSNIRMIISKAIKSLESKGVTLSKAEWLSEAERCEAGGSPETCNAVVQEIIGMGVNPADFKSVWKEDAERCIARGSIHTARCIYNHAAYHFKTKTSFWKDLAMLEKKYGPPGEMLKVLETAVGFCPTADHLWVLAAKEEFTAGNLDSARQIIAKAYKASPQSDQIWLAAAKIEQEDGKFDDARKLLALARSRAPSARVWMKSAILERLLNNDLEELKLLKEGVEKYPDFDKLWLMLGQYYERSQRSQAESTMDITPMTMPGSVDKDEARGTYTRGRNACPTSVALWICAIRYEEKAYGSNSARALCERGRLKLINSPELWVEAVRIERRANQLNAAKLLCSRALQQFGKFGLLWVELIEMEVKIQDKASRFSDAFKQCDSDPNLIAAGARIFVESRKIRSAREWFERAIKTNATFGDVWASYYKFELQHGTAEARESLIKRCIEAAPRYGEKWISVSKDPKNYKMTTKEILTAVALIVP